MSSRVVIKTLRFCTSCIENLEHALRSHGIEYKKTENSISFASRTIHVRGDSFYMNVDSADSCGLKLFHDINSRLAEVEAVARKQELEKLTRERERAESLQEGYRIRRIKAEQERLAYEKAKLELEKQNYVEAKKQAIIAKAKSMGYSVEERNENGAVKLKLVRRVY